ncbi:transcriptional regulator NrdR [Calorimonas adulescens]|uniref:Transcriptional repressor NrdR n=1 Tax=Calorimonas adulescens TaxID=2606906 RepID=A0A5D8QBS9_9THEO|nr:transcriptional regulator NrdR [Calorimonas adulescens]TZE81962.1 transcriptional repressor NrdR [Calorimonas adulescens]
MRCPFCGNEDTKVIDSRSTDEGNSIRRRRECERCGRRFTTYEKLDEIPYMVIKKDGSREPFDRNKILNGLIKACEKRPVSINVLDDIVKDLEKRLYNNNEKEVPTQLIGEMVMDALKDTDEVAYVRFASVYRQFKDVSTFMDEIKKLMDEKR